MLANYNGHDGVGKTVEDSIFWKISPSESILFPNVIVTHVSLVAYGYW